MSNAEEKNTTLKRKIVRNLMARISALNILLTVQQHPRQV
jgi:hypothetical protein